MYIKLIILLVKDFIKNIKIKKAGLEKPHLYGIYGYFGLPGKGKTMTMSYILQQIREKHGDNVLIATNYFWKGQDFEFRNWRQLMKSYDKPLVVAWDEVQNEFNSRAFQSFPVELLTILTQNRKGNGVQIHYTAQRWNRVDKVFRELTHKVGQCNTILGRLGIVKYYDWEDYEQLLTTPIVEMKMRIRPLKKMKYIQTDELRESYNSYQMLKSAKGKEYINRNEIPLT